MNRCRSAVVAGGQAQLDQPDTGEGDGAGGGHGQGGAGAVGQGADAELAEGEEPRGGYTWVAESMRSLVPLLEKFGIVTGQEPGRQTLSDRYHAEVIQTGMP